MRNASFSEPLEVLRKQIFGSVNDAQILRTAALERRLDQPSTATRNEREWLRDHPLATTRREVLPPSDRGLFRRRVRQIDDTIRRRARRTVESCPQSAWSVSMCHR